QTVDGERVSSTRVRAALAAGNLALAAELLGRRYRMSGTVIGGERLGRQLGFPTANVRRPGNRLPLHGIFLVRVYGLGDEPLYGVASCGSRPTVNGEHDLVEVYLFDFAREIYGAH